MLQSQGNGSGGENDARVSSLADGVDQVPLFSPPLWRQRRALISKILKENDVHSVRAEILKQTADPCSFSPVKYEKVLDLGCGEGALLEILLNDTTFTRVAGVDVDEDAIQLAEQNCQPNDHDRRFLRETPVECKLFQGSVADADCRFVDFDAITSVEVVEHLDPPVLDAFPATTLGTYQPRLMIVTTPNAEFNVNFPNLNYGTPDAILRNDDHRFEWTRKEFQTWYAMIMGAHWKGQPEGEQTRNAPFHRCTAAAEKYGYSVSFTGVGVLVSAPGDLSRGHCTQVAIFKRNVPSLPAVVNIDSLTEQYRLHATIDFPYFAETGFTDADILTELRDRTGYLVYNELYNAAADARDASNPGSTTTPVIVWPQKGEATLPIDTYWSVLRIRQICKSRSRLVEVLTSPLAASDFAVLDGDKVHILFEIPREDEQAGPDEEDWDGFHGTPVEDDEDEDFDHSANDEGMWGSNGLQYGEGKDWTGPAVGWDVQGGVTGIAWEETAKPTKAPAAWTSSF
ncbi:Small RNA 2'-O-methyltransferase [Borealophlyctis nickersoniae]|nr:Small RNA 2'-O-methyltransferase [Borealophlyctis nickersoniae]